MRARGPGAALAALTALGVVLAGCRESRVDPESARAAREAMLFRVASQFREPAASLGVLAFEPVTWGDVCLGIRRRGPCAEQPTEGYLLRVRRRGETYEFHAPAASPTDVALASAPDPRIGAPALAWSWESAPGGCQTLLVSADGRPAVGWCDGPTAELTWLGEGFAGAEWSYLLARFTPFERAAGERTTAFAGSGTDESTAAWQDAIERWAALRWAELNAGRSGAAHGRALAYRRPVRDRAGWCDVLEATEYGVALLGRSQCEGGGGGPGRAVWLSNELWEEMNGWLKEWGPYTDEGAGVFFFGTGTKPPDGLALTAWMDLAMAHAASEPRDAWPAAGR